jgi:hypothetical protein
LSSLRLSNHLAYADQNQFILKKFYATKSVYMYSKLQIDKKNETTLRKLHICLFVLFFFCEKGNSKLHICLTSPRRICNLRESHCLVLGNLEAKNALIIKILYETYIKYCKMDTQNINIACSQSNNGILMKNMYVWATKQSK